MSETFTERYTETYTVAKIDGNSVTSTDSWGAWMPPEVAAVLRVGDRYTLETYRSPFGFICGWQIGGRWVSRKSDQQLQAEHEQRIEDGKRRDRERLDKHRAEWIGRTENLPGWLQDRVQTFRERGGEKFELEGWGYELCVAELAVLYDRHPEAMPREVSYADLPQSIRDYDEQHGCSGNQHDCARALVRHHQAGGSLAGTVSALSPITGDAFYAGDPS